MLHNLKHDILYASEDLDFFLCLVGPLQETISEDKARPGPDLKEKK